MAESSDPVIFTKKAQRGTGANAVDGVCMISRTKVKWEPSDPSKAQPTVIEISSITSKQPCASGIAAAAAAAAAAAILAACRLVPRCVLLQPPSQGPVACMRPPCPSPRPAPPAGTQQAPGKPFIKLETAAGPLILAFQQVADRDDAVELLRQAKPAAAPKAAAAAAGSGGEKLLLPTPQQAAALFRADNDLESVYKSLVVAGILGEQEFWRTRQGQLRDALARGGGGGGGGASRRQRVGLPSAMLADVKPSADGQTEKVHFSLTPQIIQQASASWHQLAAAARAGMACQLGRVLMRPSGRLVSACCPCCRPLGV